MRLPRFEYVRPQSVEEASAILTEAPGKALPIAGGTDLLVAMKQRASTPQYLVDLKGLPNLDRIEHKNGTLSIGALTTLRQITDSPLVQEKFTILAQAARKAASPQVRNLATIGGNICLRRRCWYYNQSLAWRQSRPPCLRMGGAECYVVKGSNKCYALHCADTIPALLVLEAKVKLISTEGERTTTLGELYLELGPKSSTIERGEILTEVLLPEPPSASYGLYLKYSHRPSIDFPLVGVAATMKSAKGNEVCEEARVAVGALCPKPMRLKHAEEVLKGERINPTVISKFVEAAAEEVKPIPYIYCSPGYKRKLVRSLLLDAIEQVWQRAKLV